MKLSFARHLRDRCERALVPHPLIHKKYCSLFPTPTPTPTPPLSSVEYSDTEMKVSSAENPKLSKVIPCKAWNKSEYSRACYVCCQEFGLSHLAFRLHSTLFSPVFLKMQSDVWLLVSDTFTFALMTCVSSSVNSLLNGC